MITAKTISIELAKWMRTPDRPKNYELRDYLGMSGIGQCPRQQYWRVVSPKPADDRQLWYAWTGYSHEEAMIELLRGAGLDSGFTPTPLDDEEGSLIADFDPRFRGHVDYVYKNTVIDIKTTYFKKFVTISTMNDGPLTPHLDQMQMYMAHGGFDHALLIYLPRDIPHYEWDLNRSAELAASRTEPPTYPAFKVFDVPKDEALIGILNQKARLILEHIDKNQPPPCECGRCTR